MAERRLPAAGKRSPPKKASAQSGRTKKAVPANAPASLNGELTAESHDVAASVAHATTVPAVAAHDDVATKVVDLESPVTPVSVQPASNSAAASTPSPASTVVHGESKSHTTPARVLDVFLIDSGWNTPVRTAVQENLPAVAEFLEGHRFFVLNLEQSMLYIKRHPALVGADPIMLVVDRKAAAVKNTEGCGFRLCLGHVRQPEVAISMLKWAVQLTLTASSNEMVTIIRKSAHRETLQGAIELIGEGSTHLLEFAPV